MKKWKVGDHIKYKLKNMRDENRGGEAIISNSNEEKICIGYRWYFKENVEILEILHRPKKRLEKEDWEL